MCCEMPLPPRAEPAYCARGFSRLRKSFLEIITLKIVQQVSRFLTFFFFFMRAELCIRDRTPSAAQRLILVAGTAGKTQSDSGDTKLTGMGSCVRSPNHPHLTFARVGSVLRCFLIRLDASSKERGQTSRDNAFDGDKNVSMELYSKTRIAALYLMCTHFILAICLK